MDTIALANKKIVKTKGISMNDTPLDRLPKSGKRMFLGLVFAFIILLTCAVGRIYYVLIQAAGA